ncbi:MAG: glycosyltransferase [Deltaproteobacteria bacterium]|nr:glycosyltransferase [Deltaproteobacteria bacterium]
MEHARVRTAKTARDVLSYAAIVWHRFRPAVPHPWQLLRLAHLARTSLKTNGVSGLKRRFLEGAQATADYRSWIRTYDTLSEAERAAMRQHIDRLTYKPLISVVMPTYNTPEKWLRLAIESVRKQLYPYWELCIADDASSRPHVRQVLEQYREQDPRITVVLREHNGHISIASNSAISVAGGEFVAFLDHDDELSEHALYMVAVELNAHPEVDILYSDEDKIDGKCRRYDPYFKPDWNPDLFQCQNFVSHLGVYRTCRVREVDGFRVGYEGSQDWDLAMRIVEQIPSSQIRHIPQVLYHWRAIAGSTALDMEQKDYVKDAQVRLLASHFRRIGIDVTILPTVTSHWRIQYPLPQSPPLVTLIIPARSRFDLFQRCIESIQQKTTYPRYELLVVTDQVEDPCLREYVSQLARERRATVLCSEVRGNDAALWNWAVPHARGEVIGLLSSGLKVISPDWLKEMVSHALRPEIGAVGALLYSLHDTIQQAGLIMGLGEGGIAGHAHAGKPRGYTGHNGRAVLTQNLSAVSAACLMLRPELFQQVGGLDEEHLPFAFYDIDLCLRIRALGYRNLWTPYAEFYHDESASRGHQETSERPGQLAAAVTYLQQRWGALLAHDPAYNPNLALDRESFMLAFPPRGQKPRLAEAATTPPAIAVRWSDLV